MTSLLYLLALLASAFCMGLLDHRFRLALFRAPWRTVLVVACGVAFFLAWDLVAIASGHYVAGQSAGMTHLMIAPELPLEELVFVTFFSYITLVLFGLVHRVLERGDRAARESGRGRGGQVSQGTRAARRGRERP